ncbi:MAG: diadenylate cyclase CdaA [Lachnospiraceae bacterium]|nr:diadenylate cyclase CdaA [Lachnospiraceae bacterium]
MLNGIREFLRNILHQIQAVRIAPKNILEILVLAVLVYYLILWIKRSRAWVLLRGIVVLLIFVLLAKLFELNVISFIADRTLSILVIALLVLFQPELRAALEQIGQGKFIRYFLRSNRSQTEKMYPPEAIKEIVDASFIMGRNKTGALICLEREIELKHVISSGIRIDGVLTSALLINIFEKNTPLHDGAVVLQGNKVTAATCYLPMSENKDISKELGTRHRAAIGLSEETDSWIVVVSEETGDVSLARGGELLRGLTPDELRAELLKIEDDFSAEKLRQEAENRRLRSRRRISGKEVPELQTQAVTEDAEEGERYAEKISE